jgi:hypothetical protein
MLPRSPDIYVYNRTTISKTNKEIRIKMNTLKFTKWLGLTLLCVAILSAPLAQIGLQAVRNLQDKPSQLELIQETGEQIDMIESLHQLVNAAPADGEYEYVPAGTAKMLDPSGRIPGSAPAAYNPADGEYEYVPAGTAKMLDPSGRIPGSAPAAYNPADGEYEYVPVGTAKTLDPTGAGRIVGSFTNPADGEYEYLPAGYAKTLDPSGRVDGAFTSSADGEYDYVPAGWAKTLDNTGRIQGIAAIDPTNGSVRIQGIAAIDPTNSSVRIQAGTDGSDKDDDNSYVLTTVIKDRRPLHKRK